MGNSDLLDMYCSVNVKNSQLLIGPSFCAFGPHFNLRSFVYSLFSTSESTLRRVLRSPMNFMFPHCRILAANASLGSDTPTAFVEDVGRDDGVSYNNCCGHQ